MIYYVQDTQGGIHETQFHVWLVKHPAALHSVLCTPSLLPPKTTLLDHFHLNMNFELFFQVVWGLPCYSLSCGCLCDPGHMFPKFLAEVRFCSWATVWLSEKRSGSVIIIRSSHRGSVVTNLNSIHEDAVQSLALLSGLMTRHCCELWCRSKTQLGSGIAVLRCRPAAAALIQPVAWELPYAMGAALKRQ